LSASNEKSEDLVHTAAELFPLLLQDNVNACTHLSEPPTTIQYSDICAVSTQRIVKTQSRGNEYTDNNRITVFSMQRQSKHISVTIEGLLEYDILNVFSM
jgi:hypothetical protein